MVKQFFWIWGKIKHVKEHMEKKLVRQETPQTDQNEGTIHKMAYDLNLTTSTDGDNDELQIKKIRKISKNRTRL